MVYVVYGITKYLVSIYTTKLKEGFSMGKIVGLVFNKETVKEATETVEETVEEVTEKKEDKKKSSKKENKEGAE